MPCDNLNVNNKYAIASKYILVFDIHLKIVKPFNCFTNLCFYLNIEYQDVLARNHIFVTLTNLHRRLNIQEYYILYSNYIPDYRLWRCICVSVSDISDRDKSSIIVVWLGPKYATMLNTDFHTQQTLFSRCQLIYDNVLVKQS